MKKYLQLTTARALTLTFLLTLGLAGTASAQLTETHSFTNLNRAVPDGNQSGLAEFREVASSISALSSVRVKLRIAGEYNGDLYAYLAHDSGFTVLLNRPGKTAADTGGYGDSGFDVTFDGTAAAEIHSYRSITTPAAGAPLTGTWQPDGRIADPSVVTDLSPRSALLNSFSNLNGAGEWVLFVADLESGGTNMLLGWELELTGRGTPVITWPAPSGIVYGTALDATQLNAAASVAGSFTYSPASGTVLNAGAAQTLTAVFTPSNLASYRSVTQTVTISVAPAPLQITAEDKAKVFGAPLPALTATYSGFVNGNTPASLDAPVSLTTTATASSNAGTYAIIAGGAADANYAITFVNGTLTISRAPTIASLSASTNFALAGEIVILTTTLAAVAPGVGTPDGLVQFRDNGVPLGAPVAASGGVASLLTTTLPAGSHNITADYAGSGNFEPSSAALAAPVVINTAPVAGADSIERFPRNGVKVLVATLLANDSDADGEPVTFNTVSGTSTAGGTVTLLGDWIRYSPPSGYTNADSFTYTITDGRGSSSIGTVTVAIRNDTSVSENVVIEPLEAGAYRVRFAGLPGTEYEVQYSDSLNPPAWASLGIVTTDALGRGSITNTPPQGVLNRFYRTVR